MARRFTVLVNVAAGSAKIEITDIRIHKIFETSRLLPTEQAPRKEELIEFNRDYSSPYVPQTASIPRTEGMTSSLKILSATSLTLSTYSVTVLFDLSRKLTY